MAAAELTLEELIKDDLESKQELATNIFGKGFDS